MGSTERPFVSLKIIIKMSHEDNVQTGMFWLNTLGRARVRCVSLFGVVVLVPPKELCRKFTIMTNTKPTSVSKNVSLILFLEEVQEEFPCPTELSRILEMYLTIWTWLPPHPKMKLKYHRTPIKYSFHRSTNSVQKLNQDVSKDTNSTTSIINPSKHLPFPISIPHQDILRSRLPICIRFASEPTTRNDQQWSLFPH